LTVASAMKTTRFLNVSIYTPAACSEPSAVPMICSGGRNAEG